MTEKIKKLFESQLGTLIYGKFLRTVNETKMRDMIFKGVLVGFSGGPDSVILLLLLNRYISEQNRGKIVSFHLNHLIRGDEADRDENFSRDFCKRLNIEFISEKRDIPHIAKMNKLGIEECARNERYSCFSKIIQGRKDLSCVAVAHNATDNIETVLMNILRGSGLKGVSGIPPIRDNIIRPVINIPKDDIVRVLTEFDIPFVTDSTNLSVDYSRNYVRHNFLPMLRNISKNPEKAFMRMSENLRSDNSFIEDCAASFLSEYDDKPVSVDKLNSLHPAVISRVLSFMAKSCGVNNLEYTHIKKISELLSQGDFKYSLPGKKQFVSSKGKCYIRNDDIPNIMLKPTKLKLGFNYIEGYKSIIVLADSPIDSVLSDCYSNVYKISIQHSFNFDIIEGGIAVRCKLDGDSYKYGGITHKLKKLFNDRDIPTEERPNVPIFTDKQGIFWVPGFGTRQDVEVNSNKILYIAVAHPEFENEAPDFYIPRFKSRSKTDKNKSK